MVSKTSLGTRFRYRHLSVKSRSHRLSNAIEEQHYLLKNLRYISLLFYLPIILMLLYFWL